MCYVDEILMYLCLVLCSFIAPLWYVDDWVWLDAGAWPLPFATGCH